MGLQESTSTASVQFAQGVEMDSSDTSGIDEAVKLATENDVAIVFLGLRTCQETGPMCQEAEAKDRKHIYLPGKQEQLLKAVWQRTPIPCLCS